MPRKKIGEGKRYPLNMRTTKEMREKLERAAAQSGRSLVQEVEFRLERSFDREEISREMSEGREKLSREMAQRFDRISKELGDALNKWSPQRTERRRYYVHSNKINDFWRKFEASLPKELESFAQPARDKLDPFRRSVSEAMSRWRQKFEEASEEPRIESSMKKAGSTQKPRAKETKHAR
jgi:TraY domain